MQNSSVLAHLKLKKIIFLQYIFKKNLNQAIAYQLQGWIQGPKKGGTNKKVSKRGIPPGPVLSYFVKKLVIFFKIWRTLSKLQNYIKEC